MIRPAAARWFEVLAARDDAFAALEALAQTGAVEIEWHRATPPADQAARANRLLRDYAALARRHRAYWPAPRLRARASVAPADALAAAVAGIARWETEAGPTIVALQAAETALAELASVERVLASVREAPIDFSAVGGPDARLAAAVFAYPAQARLALPPSLLLHAVAAGDETFLLAVGAPAAIEQFAGEVGAAGRRRAALPDWLRPGIEDNLALIAERRGALAAEAAAHRAVLTATAERHRLAVLLGDVVRASWCFEHAQAIDAGEIFSHISGWTSAPDALAAAIEGAHARALIDFPSAPRGARPPLYFHNPWWARPFELFARLFGMPGQHGVDPSILLALIVPLLFGYMFGDVGQGLVLVAAGFWLRRRLPILRLLIPAGAAATAFGFLFGSVFSLEHVIAPLWVHPLEHPLLVLAVPIAGGVVLLSAGFGLSALEAHWRGELRDWLRGEGLFALVFYGLLAAFVHPAGAAVAGAAAAAFVLAHARAPERALGGLKALGELVERTMQILINTLSFARVGAFALAHAGLSLAVVAIAQLAGGTAGYVVTVVLGNVLILALEGLVVSIQTTRLVLLEFFARFFQAEGRDFRPLAPPPVSAQEA